MTASIKHNLRYGVTMAKPRIDPRHRGEGGRGGRERGKHDLSWKVTDTKAALIPDRWIQKGRRRRKRRNDNATQSSELIQVQDVQ